MKRKLVPLWFELFVRSHVPSMSSECFKLFCPLSCDKLNYFGLWRCSASHHHKRALQHAFYPCVFSPFLSDPPDVSTAAPDLVLNPQVVEQTTYMEDRPMFMLQCAYEENCLSSTSSQVPANSYRRLLRFSSQIHNNGQSDFRPKADRHSWVWHDCHRSAFDTSFGL